MAEFQFLKNRVSKMWVVLAPKRAKRPDVRRGGKDTCPFCVGHEANDEVYRLPEDSSQPWRVRVVRNKFPFAPIHEVVVLSPDHTESFPKLTHLQIEDILKVYRHRFNEHSASAQIIVFHNSGHEAGESLPHPHSQIVGVPFEVNLRSPLLKAGLDGLKKREVIDAGEMMLFCPQGSEWPDEVWIAPKRRGKTFGDITEAEISDLASSFKKLVILMEHRHEDNFPCNFYIYSGDDWYLRLIPRLKRIGGFEFATNILVNTQDPRQTLEFLKKHFKNPDPAKIRSQHKAEYHRTA